MRAKTLSVAAGCALSAASAQAQFLNADFETGTTAGWVVVNTAGGTGAPGSVTVVDIDGPGPLGATFAATFSVGRSSSTQPGEQGIEMTQPMVLTGGQLYTFEFDWAALRSPTGGSNAQGGVFSLIVDGTIIASQSAGSTSGAIPRYGHLSTPFTPATTGNYVVGVRITRPFTVPADLFQHVDNFRPAAGGGPTGACCLPTGACTITSAAACAAQTGIYRGDGTTCPANCPQPPTGACCLPDLSCATLSQIACTAAGGTYRGDNVPCATAGCPTPGACCFPDGSCVSLLSAECTTASGVFRGDGSACATAACWTAPVLWKNGPLDTGATAANGAPAPAPSHWSEVQAANATCANNVAGFSGYSSTFRLADDFVVTGGGWHLDRIIIPAYLTGSTPTASPFTQAFVQIWNGRPGDPGAAVVYGDTTTNRLTGSNFSDLFRIFHTTTPPPGTAPGTTRPIYNNVLSVDVDLAPGTYWLEFATTVNSNPATAHFAPSNTLRGLYGGRGLSANGRQLTIATGVWADAIDGGFPAGCHPPVTQDFPFTLVGSAMGGCYADCNQDHALNVNDFICFQSAFAAGAPYADCDNNQQQNVNDFICFQAAFAAGCSQL